MLSKPWLIVSGGRYAVTSMSTSSRSLTDCAYSARVSRWNGRHPGLGFDAAQRSMRLSSAVRSACSVASSGRRAPAGGIMFSRSLRMMCSAISGCSVARVTSNVASDRPPALPRSLWQPMQYCLTVCVAGSGAGGAAGAWARRPAEHSPIAAEAAKTFVVIPGKYKGYGQPPVRCREPAVGSDLQAKGGRDNEIHVDDARTTRKWRLGCYQMATSGLQGAYRFHEAAWETAARGRRTGCRGRTRLARTGTRRPRLG